MTMALMTTLLKSPNLKDTLEKLSFPVGLLTGEYQPPEVKPYLRIIPPVYGFHDIHENPQEPEGEEVTDDTDDTVDGEVMT